MKGASELRQLLQHSNLSAVSRASGIHRNTLYRFMKGAKPQYETLEKLNEYFGGVCANT